MTVKGYVFLKLETTKDVVSQRSKKPPFRTPYNSKHAKQSENLDHSTSIILFYHFGRKWVGKYWS